jgi:hypothetical protein
MAYNLVLASDGPENCAEYFTRRLCYQSSGSESFRKYLNQQYYDVLNRVLTSRHRKKDRRRFPTLHKEAKAIFVVRVHELMEEAHLHLSPWACSNKCSDKYAYQRAARFIA